MAEFNILEAVLWGIGGAVLFVLVYVIIQKMRGKPVKWRRKK